MRVALNMPYQTEQSEFERIDGEIEIDGQLYKFVKRKVENGQLVVMCLPHSDKEKLRDAKNEFFKMTNDLQQETKGKKSESKNSTAFKNFLSEYRAENNNWASTYFPLTILIHTGINSPSLFASQHGDTPEQPPEFC